MLFFVETYSNHMHFKCIEFANWKSSLASHNNVCQQSGESLSVFKTILVSFQKCFQEQNHDTGVFPLYNIN